MRSARADVLGQEFVGSLSLGVGQFCTNPGLVIALESSHLDRFIASTGSALNQVAPGVMLTPGIHSAYEQGVERLLKHPQVTALARGVAFRGKHCGSGALFSVAARDVLQHREVMDEVFGPSSVVIRCVDESQVIEVLENMEGQLTATLHLTAPDEPMAARLLPVFARLAPGVLSGFPRRILVTVAMKLMHRVLRCTNVPLV